MIPNHGLPPTTPTTPTGPAGGNHAQQARRCSLATISLERPGAKPDTHSAEFTQSMDAGGIRNLKRKAINNHRRASVSVARNSRLGTRSQQGGLSCCLRLTSDAHAVQLQNRVRDRPP